MEERNMIVCYLRKFVHFIQYCRIQLKSYNDKFSYSLIILT